MGSISRTNAARSNARKKKKMNEIGPRKVRLLFLIDKAQACIKLSSSMDCDLLFLDVAAFASRAVSRRQFLHDEASRVSLEDLITKSASEAPEKGDQARPCSPFGVCDPSTKNSQFCFCCDDGKEPVEGEFASPFDSIEACAQCLCLLRRHSDFPP